MKFMSTAWVFLCFCWIMSQILCRGNRDEHVVMTRCLSCSSFKFYFLISKWQNILSCSKTFGFPVDCNKCTKGNALCYPMILSDAFGSFVMRRPILQCALVKVPVVYFKHVSCKMTKIEINLC